MTSQYISNGNCAMMQYEALGDPAYLRRAFALWAHDVPRKESVFRTILDLLDAGAYMPDHLTGREIMEAVQ